MNNSEAIVIVFVVFQAGLAFGSWLRHRERLARVRRENGQSGTGPDEPAKPSPNDDDDCA